MFSLIRLILLAIPFFIIFLFVKNKRKFTIIYFSIYAFIVLMELLYSLYIYITVIKK
jgi:hypothetical protein